MARKKISAGFRKRLSEKLMDLGNLVATGLIVGQFVNTREISLGIMTIAIIFIAACYIISFMLDS